MTEKYVAIYNNADKLCKLLVEFEYNDKKTLSTGEAWDLGGGFSLVATQIDPGNDKVWFSLAKNGTELDTEIVAAGTVNAQDRVYTYTADIGGEKDVPVFSCYVDAVFGVNNTNIVQVKYVFLIDADVLEIKIGETYGCMEVTTATAIQIVLENDDSSFDLDADRTEHIMGDMYFKIADDNTAIRFYPYVEYTIGSVVDLTAPTVSLVTLSPTTVVSGGLVTVTVVATDVSGIASVTANGTTGTVMLTSMGSDIWQGTITAPGTNGTCNVTVVAVDASTSANANTDTSKSFTTINRIAGDVTGNGVVNIGDAVLLFNWVSFPNERGTTYVLK